MREEAAETGCEFQTMAESGEVGHWDVLKQMNASAGHAGVQELAAWALRIQQRRLEGARAGSKTLAANEDSNEPA
jgi:hypothetical protein